ncbi:hypothetical protein AAEO56_19020 [Flavobacterium sp. DGU11]|uniref:Addiction module component n=1 Tax=Flavobacterium arundinis TaxID=3139143 RepID=A0ABU9I1S6_9FLAO
MEEDLTIPEWRKEVVLERMKNFSEEDHIPLEIAMLQIRRKNNPQE